MDSSSSWSVELNTNGNSKRIAGTSGIGGILVDHLSHWIVGFLINIEYSTSITVELRLCLFGDEIGWIKNLGEKMGMKTFLNCVWLGMKDGK